MHPSMFCPSAGSIQAKLADCDQRQKLYYAPLLTKNAVKPLRHAPCFPFSRHRQGSCTAVHRAAPFASIKASLSRRAYMDRWLNNAPALAFIKDLSTWLIINSRCEPILWSDDDKDLAWLFACVLECGANNQTKLIVKNGRAKNLSEVAVRRTSRAGIQRPAVVLPIRSA